MFKSIFFILISNKRQQFYKLVCKIIKICYNKQDIKLSLIVVALNKLHFDAIIYDLIVKQDITATS